MLRVKLFVSYCAVLALLFGMAGPVRAALTGGPDIIPAPDSIIDDPPGATNTAQQAFNERQGVILPVPVTVDSGIIPAGTLVDSHMIFLNTIGTSLTSDLGVIWTFDGPVIGVMSDSSGTREAASNAILGAVGTTYPGSFAARGMEGADTYAVAANTITVDMEVTEPGDWIRVVTEVVEECDPDPRSQGYWHRQCMGAGRITPGRNGRGPTTILEPEFEKELIPAVDLLLQNTVPPTMRTCEDGMDAVPPSDPCERALKQYTALLLNIESGRLQNSCEIDLASVGCTDVATIGDLVGDLAAYINTGAPDLCREAAECAGTINEGLGIILPVPNGAPLTADADPGASGSGGEVSEPTPVVAESVIEPIPATAGRTPAPVVTDTAVVEPSASPASAPIVFVEVQGAETPEASKTDVPAQVPDADIRKSLERHFAVLVDSTVTEESRKDAEDTLLTALGGGYEPDVRLRIIRGLVGNVDESLNSLLAKHLEDIRSEAEELGEKKLAKEAGRLLKSLEFSGESEE